MKRQIDDGVTQICSPFLGALDPHVFRMQYTSASSNIADDLEVLRQSAKRRKEVLSYAVGVSLLFALDQVPWWPSRGCEASGFPPNRRAIVRPAANASAFSLARNRTSGMPLAMPFAEQRMSGSIPRVRRTTTFRCGHARLDFIHEDMMPCSPADAPAIPASKELWRRTYPPSPEWLDDDASDVLRDRTSAENLRFELFQDSAPQVPPYDPRAAVKHRDTACARCR